MRFFRALRKAYSAFASVTTPTGQAIIIIFLLLIFITVFSVISNSVSDAYDTYHANHLSAAEHLRTARDLCHGVSGVFTCIDPNDETAIEHLKKIPLNAPEYNDAAKLLAAIQANHDRLLAIRQRVEQEQATLRARQEAERLRLTSQSEDESRLQMWRNLSGEAHDSFICGTSPDGNWVLSFDYGHYWWKDDGRCTAKQEQARQQQQQAEQQNREHEQKKRDEEAELSSYWPTTLRVGTDMDSFWLPNEERTCQTYPDDKGQISTVACNATGSHRDHNIPVKFWGGVDRNTISNWKCRRESDEFVCRAID